MSFTKELIKIASSTCHSVLKRFFQYLAEMTIPHGGKDWLSLAARVQHCIYEFQWGEQSCHFSNVSEDPYSRIEACLVENLSPRSSWLFKHKRHLYFLQPLFNNVPAGIWLDVCVSAKSPLAFGMISNNELPKFKFIIRFRGLIL